MSQLLTRFAPVAYALMRMAFGFLFLFHGLQKTLGVFGGRVVEPASLLGVAGIIETVADALIAVGLGTIPAALIASGQMAVAYFPAHQLRAVWPIENGAELAALYSFAFLLIASGARGSGASSHSHAEFGGRPAEGCRS